jgi:hypothetical protein
VSNDYFSKFYELGYTHTELEALFEKVSKGELLTKEQYDVLMIAVDLITNLTTFDGSYDSLKDKPDIIDTIRQSNEFVTYTAFDARSKTIYVNLEQQMKKLVADVQFELSQTKADIDHKHDDRYSLLNHTHEGLYITQEEMNKNLVTKDYLDSVLAGLGGSGGGGGLYPTYTKPTISAKSNTTSIPHKKATPVTITPTYEQNDAGDLIKFSIIKNGETVYEGTEIKAHSEEVYLMHGESITYTFVAEFGDGVIKNTINGDPYPDTMVKAGTITAGVTIKGYAKSYYGVIEDKAFEVSDITNLTSAQKSSKSHTNTYEMKNQKSVYMYPESFGKLTSIKDANNFEYINSYTLTTTEYDDVTYNVYVLTDAVTVDGGFKQTFS